MMGHAEEESRIKITIRIRTCNNFLESWSRVWGIKLFPAGTTYSRAAAHRAAVRGQLPIRRKKWLVEVMGTVADLVRPLVVRG